MSRVDEQTTYRVEFNHWIEPEDVPFEGNVQASGDDEDDRAQEQWVRDQLESGNEAAWCYAVVAANVWIYHPEDAARGYVGPGGFAFEGRAVVGGMSWPSERQLWKDNLEDMQHEAMQDALQKIRESIPRQQQENRAWLLVVLDQLLERYG